MFACRQALRCFEGNELQVCYFIIQIILLKPPDFKARVAEFVRESSPDHWLQTDFHEKHMNFHKVRGVSLLNGTDHEATAPSG